MTAYAKEATLPNGKSLILDIVHHPGGAAVVALDDQNRVCLLHQYRPVIDTWIWELPAGKIDHNEPPIETVKREIEEEAGVSAAHWEALGTSFSSPGVFDETIHLYLATDLTPVPQNLEEHEVLEVHWVPLEEALERAHNGEIKDGKTIIGLFRAQAR